MNYNELISFLEKQTKAHAVEYLKNAFKLMRLNIDPKKVIIVAGTNGKGTTCATIDALLIDANQKTGLFTSPHLKKTTERIKFNGKDISEEEFIKIFFLVKDKITDFSLSHFEWLTFMAAYYFFEIKKADFAIFEVGLGGKYDSTNIIPHDTSVITTLAMDHQDILGNTIAEITENKFGIISKNNLVFHTPFSSNVISKLASKYEKLQKAHFIQACDFSIDVQKNCGTEPTFYINTKFGKFKLNLLGKRAAENTALALTVFDKLIEKNKIENTAFTKTSAKENIAKHASNVLSKIKWPGRMDKAFYQGHKIFLSGDHNPNGIESLLNILKWFDFEKVHFVVGICKDKEHKKMLHMLHNFSNSEIYLTETPIKTLHINEYDNECKQWAKYISAIPEEALQTAIKHACPNKDIIVVTGSLYLVGEIYKKTNVL